MSFQIYFRDMRQGLERTKVCVANSEEEFRNTTVEELKRKLIPGDQLEDTILRHHFKTLKENRTLGFYSVKHEGHIIAVRCRSSVTAKRPCDSLPVHGSAVTVKKTELDNYNLLTLEDDHTLGFGIKHEDEITAAETASSGLPSSPTAERPLTPILISFSSSSPSCESPIEFHCAFEEDEDDEDKVIPRSQSMDNLLFDMHQPQLE